MKNSLLVLVWLLNCWCSQAADAATWVVGPTRGTTGLERQAPCAALTAAAAGDTIQIDGVDGGGNQIEYIDDVCQPTVANLTIEGVGAKRPHIKHVKAALVFDQAGWYVLLAYGTASTYTVRNLELSGFHRDENNAQPILFGNTSFILENVYCHHSDNCILSGDEGTHTTNPVTGPNRIYFAEIYNSEFAYCGGLNPAQNTAGTSHCIYVGRRLYLHVEGSHLHDARGGQLIKSRAQTSRILYNRLCDSVPGILVPAPDKDATLVSTGASNYELDFSLGGIVHVVGNTICQSPSSANQIMLIYAHEPEWADLANTIFKLNVVNNTFVNTHTGGSVVAMQIHRTPLESQGQNVSIDTVIVNNVFAGFSGSQKILYTNHSNTTETPANNVVHATIAAANFRDALTQNYHLTGSSPALDAGGADPGTVESFALAPTKHYSHDRTTTTRTNSGTRDAGAFENTATDGAGFTAPILHKTESSTGVTLSWTAGVSDPAITQYRVFRNGSLLTTVTGALTYGDTTGVLGTAYTYHVIADRSGGTAQSNTVIAGKVRQVTGALDAALGWQEILNTTPDSVCSPATNCWAEFWRNTVAVDTTNNRLVWSNTGTTLEHPGNEIYALNLSSLTVSRLNATDTGLGGGANTLGNGRPNARHRSRLAWLPSVEKLYMQGGFIPGGTFTVASWLWIPATDTWTAPSLTGTPVDGIGAGLWDSAINRLVNVSWTCIELFDPATNTYTQPVSCSPRPAGPYSGFLFATRDPIRQRIYAFGPNTMGYYDQNNSYAYTSIASSCGVLTQILPGVSWDSVSGKIVGWTGGNTVHLLDPVTNTCTSQTFSGGPGYPFNYETSGKFQCVSSAGGCFAATTTDKNWFFLRLASPSNTPTRIGGGTISGGIRQ